MTFEQKAYIFMKIFYTCLQWENIYFQITIYNISHGLNFLE